MTAVPVLQYLIQYTPYLHMLLVRVAQYCSTRVTNESYDAALDSSQSSQHNRFILTSIVHRIVLVLSSRMLITAISHRISASAVIRRHAIRSFASVPERDSSGPFGKDNILPVSFRVDEVAVIMFRL
jgi:hypothetical protein